MARTNEYTHIINYGLGKKIRDLRLSKQVTQTNLASLIGVTHQQLHKYETGKNVVSAARLALIAKALQHNIAEFYSEIN